MRSHHAIRAIPTALIVGTVAIILVATIELSQGEFSIEPSISSILFISLVSLIARVPLLIAQDIRTSFHRRRALAGHCIRCDYDLRASSGRCPECGLIIEPFEDNPRSLDPVMAGLIVIVLITFIILASMPTYISSGPDSKPKATRATLSNIQSQLANFNIELGRYPSTAEGLAALVSSPGTLPAWKHPFMDKLPRDAWDQPFIYHSPGTAAAPYDLYSIGADGIDGTMDDISVEQQLP